MGTRIIIPTTFTAPGRKVYDDASMDAGTIWLFDPSHSMGAFSGVPANGAAIPNVARNRALAIIGAGAGGAGTFRTQRESAAALVMERTSKGGLHIASSHSAQTTENYGYIEPPAAIKQYMHGRLPAAATGFYVSFWLRVTRAQVATAAAASCGHYINVDAAATSNYLFHTQGLGPTVGGSLGANVSTTAVNSPSLLQLGCSAWVGSKPTSYDRGELILGGAGAFSAWGYFNVNKAPSLILYKVKVEDLALCKRSNGGAGGTLAEEYAAAYAADLADFTAAFAAGGKFYNDTWTAAATLCP